MKRHRIGRVIIKKKIKTQLYAVYDKLLHNNYVATLKVKGPKR